MTFAALMEQENPEAIDHVVDLLRHSRFEEARDLLKPYDLPTALICQWGTEMTLDDLLDMPCFQVGGTRVVKTPQDPETHMSANISSTARKVLKEAYSFDVHFLSWASLQEDIAAVDIATAPTDKFAKHVRNLLVATLLCHIVVPGEVQELTAFAIAMIEFFRLFGFEMAVNNGSDDDFTISLLTDQAGGGFLFGEGKETSFLPLSVPEGKSHELCLFGFATYVARTTAPPETSSEQLVDHLGIRDLQTIDRGSEPSEFALALLRLEGDIVPVSFSIRNLLANGEIRKNDAIYLWASVMQACHYTVAKKKTMSMVMSVKMIWFIRLETKDEKCFISISDPYQVGAAGCNRTLFKFLYYASATTAMEKSDIRLWERALGAEAIPPSGPSENRPNTEQPERGGGSGHRTPKRKHPPRGDSGTTKSHSAFAKPENGHSPNSVTECGNFLSMDKYGVVPYFDQIGKSKGVLGRGRCGTVTRVEWEGRDAALKTFVLQKDKGDTPHVLDVYEHELEVLDSLRPLWGTYAPQLLFHKPWPTSPMIGLQLGHPIREDDISEWPEEDQRMLEDTLSKLNSLGWSQTDMRGTNFMRLLGGDGIERIAVIDFESMAKTTP